ncbi:MAG: nicotinate-nucleotide--dimethylbenzimidazole phosphoribosyltransferase [Clostridiales bacterium]|nr:nicotinate-nucleotide--dimethylbenzimidazole phosphoribosyltransferase [Clostridiales bacterium]
MTFVEAREQIQPLDEKAMKEAQKRWDTIAKPLHSLGDLETMLIRIAGIQRSADADISRKALIVMCADNGVVEEGVTQTGQEVTAIVAENFLVGSTTSCIMSRQCGTDVFPVDVGMARDTKVRTDLKVACGTANMTKGPAMSREQAVKAIEAGISMAVELKEKGYRIFATGEMGIGNTTTSSAVASVLMGEPVEEMTGRGAGLSSEGLARKINAIHRAIQVNQPNPEDALDVLSKVGGFDIAGMAGVCIGGAALGIPVVLDGFISCAAALTAVRLCPMAGEYLLASHVSREPAAGKILSHMGKEAPIRAGMCLGEGTGAVTLFPLLDMASAVYHSMDTFDEIHVEQYEELK